MKRYRKYFKFLLATSIFCLVGCSNLFQENKELSENNQILEVQNGNVTVSMFIPDYKVITESRVIAPQTKYVRLKILKKAGSDTYYDNDITLEIKSEDLTAVEGAGDIGIPGKIWKANFSVPAGTYKTGTLVVELLDSEKNAITSGNNTAAITITEDTSTSCSFFTVPLSSDNDSGSLALNEMKFFKVSNSVVGEKLTAIKAELGGAVIIRFNSDGTFGEVLSDFAKDSEIEITDKTLDSYYGIWAKDAAVESYSVEFVLSKYILDGNFIENFDTELNTNFWTVRGDTETSPTTAKVTASSVYELEGTSTIKIPYKNSSLSRTVYVSEPKSLTFSFYPDGNYTSSSYGNQELIFAINGEEKGRYSGVGVRQSYTFPLEEAGTYELEWYTNFGMTFSSSGGMGNEVYLDSVSIVSDEVSDVEITPKGMQTLIAGKDYDFTANAFRADGSIIKEKSVTETKNFSTEGEQSFTMTVDGISATANVFVVKDDVTSPVKYMGNVYSGIDESSISGSVENQLDTLASSYAKLKVTYPNGNNFNADGFFPLKLNVNNPDKYQFVAILVSSDNHDEESYFYRGNPTTETGELETRIWLRWGKGTYTVKIYDAASCSWSYSSVDGTVSEDGSVTYYGDNVPGLGYNKTPSVTFTVENTRDEDGSWLYPSSVVQADDLMIMNKATELTAGLTDNNAKIKAIHDWIVTSKFYDYDSLSARKRQDAVAVMTYGMCVCEGYANLTAALLRNCGIQIKVISSTSLVHAWNNVNVGSAEAADWRLLDCTWDDPTLPTGDGGPYYISYDNYLLEDLTGGSRTHSGGSDITGRFAIASKVHTGGVESTAF